MSELNPAYRRDFLPDIPKVVLICYLSLLFCRMCFKVTPLADFFNLLSPAMLSAEINHGQASGVCKLD
jgi:hypothetical protein